MKQYFLADNVFIYPSSNAKDSGSENSERNLAKITDKFTTRNFVVRNKRVKPSEDMSLSLSLENGDLKINEGACVIAGYYIKIKDTIIKLDEILPKNEDGSVKYPDADREAYSVKIQLHFDAAGNVRGDSGTSTGDLDRCYGISCKLQDIYESPSSDEDQYTLELGTVVISKQNGGATGFDEDYITSYRDRFSFIESDTIYNGSNGLSLDSSLELSFRNLTSLKFYYNPENALDPDKNPDTELYVTKGALMFRPSSTEVEYNLLDKIKLAEENGTTDSGVFEGTKKTKTNNGSSKLHARADHDHDNRYLLKQSAINNRGDLTQIIGTNLSISYELSSNSLKVAEGIETKSLLVSSDITTSGLTVKDKISAIKGLEVGSNFGIDELGNLSSSGSIKVDGTITGEKVYNAVWNDYAELYKKADPSKEYAPGTVICKVRGKDVYDTASYDNGELVVGVVSDSYGHLLGGDKGKSLEENLKKYIPIALTGRVYVKVKPGVIIHEGYLMYASVEGRASGRDPRLDICDCGTIIGKALEDTDGSKDKILMQVMLG